MVQKQKTTESVDKLAFEPPEPGYIAEREVFYIPISDERLHRPWDLRLYAAELIKQRVGDDAQVTSLKVKKPHLVRKTVAKLKKQEPSVRLLVTIKF